MGEVFDRYTDTVGNYHFTDTETGHHVIPRLDNNSTKVDNKNDELVRRQDAIDAIEKNKFSEEYCKEHNIDFSINVSMAKIALESLSSAQPEQRWIPVSEILPEDYTDVLVWFEYFRYGDYNRLYQTYGIGDYIANYGWMINHETGWHKLRVIAWQPLPSPYTQE